MNDRIEVERDVLEHQKKPGEIYPMTEIRIGDLVVEISGVVKNIKAYRIKK